MLVGRLGVVEPRVEAEHLPAERDHALPEGGDAVARALEHVREQHLRLPVRELVVLGCGRMGSTLMGPPQR